MTQQISEGRKTAYYIGISLQVIGGILFASVFVTFATHFGDSPNFGPFSNRVGNFPGPEQSPFFRNSSNIHSNEQSMIIRSFGGIALLIAGGIIRTIGARGLAGSGVILDPDKAKQDLEPYSRMAGGMVKDALDEADINLSNPGGKSAPEKVIMIKCPACNKLNEEDSNFCQHCGKKI
jgi:hypothetical protein